VGLTKAFARNLVDFRTTLRAWRLEGRKCSFFRCSNLADHIILVKDGSLMWEMDHPILYDQTPCACALCIRLNKVDELEDLVVLPIDWLLEGREIFRRSIEITITVRHQCDRDCPAVAGG
jgi:hypothetical protein